MTNIGFLKVFTTFSIVQDNKLVIDVVNELNKLRKANSISTFDYKTLISSE